MRGWATGIAATGLALLVRSAWPLRWDGIVDPTDDSVMGGLAFIAVVCGTVAGVLAGALDRRRVRAGHRSAGPISVVALLLMSLITLWPIAIFVSRLAGDSETVYGSSRLIEVCASWLVFVVLAYGWYRAVSGRLLSRNAHQTARNADALET